MKEQVVDWDGIEEFRGGLVRKVSRWSRDKSEVDDVVQETMIRAARYRVSLRESNRMDSWMARIAWNVLKSLRGREAGRPISVLENVHLDSSEGREQDPLIELFDDVLWVRGVEVERGRLASLLEGAIRALPEPEKQMVEAAYKWQMSPCAISEKFGVRRGLVKSRLYRIRQKLHRRVVEALGAEE